MKASDFFSSDEKKQILNAIKLAEKDSSGEIRVHIENKFDGDVLDRAAFIFAKLKMHKTELRNGVLFYLSLDSKQFAVIGDAGINKEVPEGFWDCVKETMLVSFKEKKFAEGLEKGILLAGDKLKTFFPYHKDDVNELSDEISFGNN